MTEQTHTSTGVDLLVNYPADVDQPIGLQDERSPRVTAVRISFFLAIGGTKRCMYMFYPQQCPWSVPDMFNGRMINNQGYRHMFPNGARFPGPGPQHFQPFIPQGMYPPRNHWQGPGPSRPRYRGYRNNRGSGFHSNNRQRNQRTENNLTRDICCKCGERLQNSEELGIHLCDGGNEISLNDREQDRQSEPGTDNNQIEVVKEEEEEALDARLEKLLENLKDFMRSKYQTVTEALEEYVTGKIEEINTLHKDNSDEKERLEKIKSELEDKAKTLEKQEKDLRDKQKRLTKDQDTFKLESKKEKEEICRQWQQLRDEISRMEEVHEAQEGRIRLDVGGQLFTTSRLTLTREEDSMLAAMFSGRHEVKMEDNGAVFIDRDGTHFRYVLNYLRDGGLTLDSLPKDRQLLKELRKEATYYQLHGLLQQIEKVLY